MRLSDLQPGDVIFTMIGQNPPAVHTQLYEGSATFSHTILHAVDDTGKNIHKLMATNITGSNEYKVYRCKTAALATKALYFGKKWSLFQTPYDADRRYMKEAFRNIVSNDFSAAAIPAEMRRIFEEKGKFRAIKYASRRDEALCYPDDETGNSRGLTCTMFVILCFQVAGIADYVRTRSSLRDMSGTVRVSDKKLSEANLQILQKMSEKGFPDPEDLRQYRLYVQGLQSGNEYNIRWEDSGRDQPLPKPLKPQRPGFAYVPSLLCWNGPSAVSAFSFEGAFSKGMMVDSKITTSEQLRLCLGEDLAGWDDLGFVDGTEVVPHDPGYKAKLELGTQLGKDLREVVTLRPGRRG